MTCQEVTLILPEGRRRQYAQGDRVVILPGHPQCLKGGAGNIHVFLDSTMVIVKLDSGGTVYVAVDSIYMEPAGEAVHAA